jgi:hypothetical protein
VDWSSSGKRIFVSEISPNLTRENVSNTTFTPRGFFSLATSFSNIYSFGISFDGSYSFLGGFYYPNPQKIHVYANLLIKGKNKLKINNIKNNDL